jgi:predicted DNA binding CopG/RHH family protein
MHYDGIVFKAVRDSHWSADHIAAHRVTLGEVREAIMTKQPEQFPQPEAELERLAEYYDTHDTSAEMETGDWVEPQPMATTSLRLPVEVIDQLKRQARARHIRYTSYVRSILERAAHDGTSPEIADITERLERIERAVTERQSPGDQKTALLTRADGLPPAWC